MYVSHSDINTFVNEVDSIIEQMGNTYILRSKRNKSWADFRIRAVSWNNGTNSTKGLPSYFVEPGRTEETGFTFVVKYDQIGFIPEVKSLIIIPQKTSAGLVTPVKVQDLFEIGEVEPISIDNVLLFLIMNTSRMEFNLWKR